MSVAGGLANTGALLGFGISLPGVGLVGVDLDIAVGDYAFVAPRDGTITSIAGFFSATAALGVLTPIQIQLQVYKATAGGNTFAPQPTPVPIGGPITALIIGQTLTGIQAVSIPVVAGEKILLYASINASIVAVATGFISAGITFN
ncbi:exosporium glycoprotein BclB-related protein [Bacillus mycoides]|uniref:exosporium glycoprotein BclB-related protein n=1 Tax=Bacillus mycoides TaxID=1405 RepID=UPI003F4E43A2